MTKKKSKSKNIIVEEIFIKKNSPLDKSIRRFEKILAKMDFSKLPSAKEQLKDLL